MSITATYLTRNFLPSWLEEFFRLKAGPVFLLLCLLDVLVVYCTQNVVITTEVYYNTLGHQLSTERMDELLQGQQKWQWISYAVQPLLILLQAAFVGICIGVGAILADHPLRFQQVFSVALKSMIVFAIFKAIHVLILMFSTVSTMDDLFKADWFTLLGWIGKDHVPAWSALPLSVVSVPQLLFGLVLSAGLAYATGKRLRPVLGLVAVSYGSGLLVLVLFLVFLQMNVG